MSELESGQNYFKNTKFFLRIVSESDKTLFLLFFHFHLRLEAK